mmetsp:Transcript_3644/g.5433  ORF Transcript_3644/g.5433 Transcript_3644/m.5433 type:complete len:205 (-) Transcript_3644:576-1190(-)
MNKNWRTFHSLHDSRHDGILHQYCKGSTTSQIICSNRLIRFGVTYHHGTKFLPHVSKISRQCQYCHYLGGNSDIEPSGTIMLYSGCARFASTRLDGLLGSNTHIDLSQVTIARIKYSIPSNGRLIKIQSCKFALLLLCQFLGFLILINSQFRKSTFHHCREGLSTWTKPLEECCIGLGIFVEESCINRCREKIISSSHCMNISC